MRHTVDEVEQERLKHLEVQAALYGPLTEPSILIEIAELRSRNKPSNGILGGSFVNSLDFDLVRSTVAAGLMRIGMIEANQAKDRKSRSTRQLIHDIWMIVITIMVFLSLLIAVYSR